MKKISAVIAALFLATVFTMSFESCGKYEEGPSFTLRSKKGRLAREWVTETFIDGSSGITVPLPSTYANVTYDKDGTMTLSVGGSSLQGEWMFSDDKTQLIEGVDFSGLGTDWDTTSIQRLTTKEFWTKDDDGDEYHYKAK